MFKTADGVTKNWRDRVWVVRFRLGAFSPEKEIVFAESNDFKINDTYHSYENCKKECEKRTAVRYNNSMFPSNGDRHDELPTSKFIDL